MKRSYLTLIGISHLALAACVVSMDLGGDSNDLGNIGDDFGGDLGGGGDMLAGDLDKDSMINDAGGADTSQQLATQPDGTTSSTDSADLGLDPDQAGRDVS